MMKMFTLIIDHMYYETTGAMHFEIVPLKRTDQFIVKNEFYTRKISNMWTIYSQVKKTSIWKAFDDDPEKVVLDMKLIPLDRLFYLSHSESHQKSGVNCICNNNNNTVAERCRNEECNEYRSQERPVNGQQWRIHIEIENDKFMNGDNEFRIRFDCAFVYWKYVIMTEPAGGEYEVTDATGDIEFVCKNDEVLGGRKVFTFTSNKKIGLMENSDRKFRLLLKKDGGSKTIIPRLPAALPGGITTKDNNSDDLISSIIINI